MKSTRIFFWVSLSLLLAPACYSQQWNLKQCIDWASTNNLSVQKQTLKNYETEISLSQAQNQRLPTVNASGEIGIENGLARESGQNYDQSRKNYPYASAGVYSQVDLWNGNRVTNSINKAKAHLEASKLEVSKTVRDVVLYITSSYLDILFQSEKLSILEANKQVTDKQI